MNRIGRRMPQAAAIWHLYSEGRSLPMPYLNRFELVARLFGPKLHHHLFSTSGS